MNFKTVILFLFLLSGFNLFSKELTGFGIAENEDLAKKYALSSLSQSIIIEIISTSESSASEQKKGSSVETAEYSKMLVQTKSELPLIGVDFKVTRKTRKQVNVTATLDSETVLPLYEKQLQDIREEIDKNQKILSASTNNTEREMVLNSLLTSLNQFNKYKIIAYFLGSGLSFGTSITLPEVLFELSKIEQNIDNIDLAAKRICSNIVQKEIFIRPATSADSDEITQFARVILDNMKKYISTVDSPENSKYIFSGTYEFINHGNEGIDLFYNLIDRSDNNTVVTKIVMLLPACYKNYEYMPKSGKFEKLLKEGTVLSNEFNIDINTNKGNDALLFKKDDEIEIFVKANAPCYFYAIEHVTKKEENQSYLIELYPKANDRSRFIRYIPGDEVNVWISLGRYKVTPPFGTERIEIIASDENVMNILPPAVIDSNGLYAITADSPNSAVIQARGLINKEKTENKRRKFTSNFITFTSFTN